MNVSVDESDTHGNNQLFYKDIQLSCDSIDGDTIGEFIITEHPTYGYLRPPTVHVHTPSDDKS